MFYPINRAEARATLEKAIETSKESAKVCRSVQDALATYKRGTLNKWLSNHIKASVPDLLMSIEAPDFPGLFYRVCIFNDTLGYSHRLLFSSYSFDGFVLDLAERLAYLENELLPQLLALQDTLDATLDRYEEAAKVIENISDIPGMFAIREYVKGLEP